MSKQLVPWSSKIFVERARMASKTASGLELPESALEILHQGKVVFSKNEALRGQEVLFDPYAGTDIKYAGQKLLVMDEADILAVIE